MLCTCFLPIAIPRLRAWRLDLDKDDSGTVTFVEFSILGSTDTCEPLDASFTCHVLSQRLHITKVAHQALKFMAGVLGR